MQTNALYNKKHFWQDMAIIFILGLTPLIWFKGGIVVAGSDAGYPLFDPVRFFLERLFVWDARVNCGMDAAIYPTSLFFHSVQAFFSWIGCSLRNSQKLLFVFWFNLIGLSIYYLISVIQHKKPDRVQRLAGVFFYAFNPLLFNVWEVGQAANLSAYVAMPVILALLIQALERRMSYLKATCLIGLFSVVVSEIGASPSIIAIPAALFFFYVLLFFIRQILSGAGFKNLFKPIVFLSAVFAVYILINAYWWMPYLKEICDKLAFKLGSDLEAFSLANWLAGISTYTSFLNVARFQGAWDWYWGWNSEPYVPYAHHYFSNMFLILVSILVPVLASLALVVRRNFYTIFFAVVAVAGNLLAMGAHMPYGNIFLWLTRNCPFFSVFRSPYYKFSLATALAYAYLVSVILSVIYNKIKNSRKLQISLGAEKTSRLAAIFIVSAVILNFIYNFPLLTGQVIKMHDYGKLFSLGIKVPRYAMDFSKWMKSRDDKETYRIMALPEENLDCYRWGYVAPPHLLNLLITKPVLWGSTGTEYTDTIRKIYYNALYKNKTDNTSKILNLLNVKYLFLPNDVWYDFYGDTDSPDFIREKLASQKNIKFARKFGEWELYEVDEPSSAVYAAKEARIVSGNIDSLAALSNSQYLDEASLVFSGQTENAGAVKNFLKSGQATPQSAGGQATSIIFCDTQIVDFALDIIENKEKCGVVKKEEKADFFINSEGDYLILLEKKSLGDIKRKISATIDDEKVIPGNDGKTDWHSQNYTNEGSIFLTKGRHRLKVPLTDIEVTDAVPVLNFIIVSRSEIEDCVKVAEEFIENKDVNFDLIFSTENMPHAINEDLSRRPKDLTISKMENFYDPGVWLDGKVWHWLKTNQQDNLFIQNESGQPMRANFGFKVASYARERTLYLYLNGELFKMIPLPRDAPVDVIVTDMEFKAGENIISFYTAFEWDKLAGRICNFAFRDFKFGALDFSQEIYIPRTGEYKIKIHPTMPLAGNNKKMLIDNKEVILNRDEKNFSEFDANMFLEQGSHFVNLSQEKSENYFLSITLPKQSEEERPKPLKYTRINPVKYKAQVDDSGEFFLIFSEAFSPNWKAYARPLKKDGGKINTGSIFEQSLVLDALRDKNKRVEIKEHYLINGYANGWHVNPVREFSSLANRDNLRSDNHRQQRQETFSDDGVNTGDLPLPYEIIIEYSPQRLFEIGLVVSGLTFILCCVGLGMCLRTKNSE